MNDYDEITEKHKKDGMIVWKSLQNEGENTNILALFNITWSDAHFGCTVSQDGQFEPGTDGQSHALSTELLVNEMKR